MYIQEDSSLPFINCIWHAMAERDGVYTDPANEYWCLGFIRHSDGSLSVELYGPSLRPRLLEGHADEEYWGIEFKVYVTLAAISKGRILNSSTLLPTVDNSLLIGNKRYAIPAYGELEKFAQQLRKDGVVMADQRIDRALQGDEIGFSERSRQRHFKSVTGLTKKQIQQLRRARYAFYLLQTGCRICRSTAYDALIKAFARRNASTNYCGTSEQTLTIGVFIQYYDYEMYHNEIVNNRRKGELCKNQRHHKATTL